MKLSEQSERFIRLIANRKRAPARLATLKTFQNRLDSVILPRLGEMDLKDIENGIVRGFIADISRDLAPTTVTATLSLLKAVIASAVDENGNRTYNRTWNADFIDAPLIRKNDLKAPLLPLSRLLGAITATLKEGKGLDAIFYALLAGSGLRAGEALAVGMGQRTGLNLWNPDKGIIYVQNTVLQNGDIQPMPKTEAGIREVDLHTDLNSFMLRMPIKSGLLFQNEGKPLIYSSVLRRMHKLGIPEGCHAFRRFRATHLDKMSVPEGLKRFWLGHASSNVSESYVKIGQDIEARKTWCEKIGLGFEL